MQNFKPNYFAITIFVVMGIVTFRFFELADDSSFHGFPAVTRCRICQERVWAWQSHERREYSIGKDSVTRLSSETVMKVHSSGIVHSWCEGMPHFEIEIAHNEAIPDGLDSLEIKSFVNHWYNFMFESEVKVTSVKNLHRQANDNIVGVFKYDNGLIEEITMIPITPSKIRPEKYRIMRVVPIHGGLAKL